MDRILVFNTYYIPAKNYGGPLTSLKNVIDNCSNEFDFYVVASNKDFNSTVPFDSIKPGWNVVGKAKVLYVDLKKIYYNGKFFKKIIKEISPSIVWSTGILLPGDNWFIANACRKTKTPFLISPRGEVCDAAFHLKYFKKKIVSTIAKFLKVYRNAFFHATSFEEIDGLKKYYNINSNRVFFAPNIPTYLECDMEHLDKEPGLIKMVFISRIMEKKNLLYTLDCLSKISNGSVIYDIYGPLEDIEYWSRCKTRIESMPKNISIHYKGQLKPEDVHNVLRNYHVFFFPTISENYGHVIVEALSSACLLLLSKGTTPWDDVHEKAGYVYDLSNENEFVYIINELIQMGQKEYDKKRAAVANYYNERIKRDNSISSHIAMFNKLRN